VEEHEVGAGEHWVEGVADRRGCIEELR
jgi:hypothetical protein